MTTTAENPANGTSEKKYIIQVYFAQNKQNNLPMELVIYQEIQVALY